MMSDKRNRDKRDRNGSDPSANQNRINEGTHIIGDIESKGFFRIDGTVKGNVNTPSKVVLGKSGKIEGTLTCGDADIEGEVVGSLKITQLLSIRASAVIDGEIIVGKLAVEPGAKINATCSMQDKPSKLANNDPKSNPYDRENRTKKVGAEKLN